MHLKLSMLSAAVVAALSLSSAAQAYNLLDLYKEAYAKDPVIQEQKATRDAAFAAIDEATAALLPQIDVIGSLGLTHTSTEDALGTNSDNRSAQIGISLSQALWKHSSWINKTIAEKNAALQDLIYNDSLQNLIIRVSTAYFNVLNASDTLSYSKANNEALKNQLDEAVKQFQVGLIAETDRLEAQSAFDLSTAEVINAENNLINSYEQIRTLIGRSITVNDISMLDTDKFSTPKVEKALKALIKEAEENNLQLQQSVVARDIAKDNIALAKTGHEPVFSLDASANTGYTNYSHEVAGTTQHDGNSWAETIGINMNIPLYHGGATTSQIKQAEHNYVAAAQALELAHRNLVSTVNNDFNNVNAAISSVKAYNQSVKSAASALNATRAGYDVGTRTMTDVLDATQSLYNAMQQAAEARYNYILSRLSLKYAQGTLKVKDLESVNNGLHKTKQTAKNTSKKGSKNNK